MSVVIGHSKRALVVRGVATLIFGFLTLLWPGITLDVMVVLFGALVFVDGLFRLAAAAQADFAPGSWRAPLAPPGVAGLIIGILTAVWPEITALALLYLIGAWAVVVGTLEVAAAVRWRRSLRHEPLLALAGALSVAFGVTLFVWPLAGALAITWFIG